MIIMNKIKKVISLILVLVLIFSMAGSFTASASVEYDAIERFVSRMYLDVMNRPYDPGGLAFWADHLRNGRITGADFAHSFFFSTEFNLLRVGDADFLNRMYIGLMDRVPDPGGRVFWLDFIQAGLPREDIFYQFVNSDEFSMLCAQAGLTRGYYDPPPGGMARIFTKRLFTASIGREPSSAELNYWHNLIKGGMTGAAAAYQLIFNTEVHNRNLNDTQFVDMLYDAMIWQPSNPADKAGYIERLQSGDSRYNVFVSFTLSSGFALICTNHGVTGGTAPPPSNMMQGTSMVARIWNMIVMAQFSGISDNPEHIAGIIGNLQSEAGIGLCPFQQQISNQVGIGLLQWSHGRRPAVEEYMWERGITPEEFEFEMNKHLTHGCIVPDSLHPQYLLERVLEAQISFMFHEFRTTEFRYLQFIDFPADKTGAEGARAYAELFCALLLRPGESINPLDEIEDEGVLEALTESIHAGGPGELNRTTYTALNTRRNRAEIVYQQFLTNQR